MRIEEHATSDPGPSCLLTFLIADIRGYTRYTAEHGDEGAARLALRFATVCETALEQHNGRVVELRGDEALAVFTSARDALRGAVALQRAMRAATDDNPSLPLNVGIGLDAGDAIPVKEGYRSGALNLAARLCSIAAGGEIFASETVAGLARRTEGLAFVDRGQVTLKGLPAPVRVLQIAPEGELPPELPPLQSILVTHPTNLPDDPTPFIGREDEIAAISSLIEHPSVRLVTLTGPGGTGKTRLALQVGSMLLHAFADGVFFCDLSRLSDASLVPAAMANVLSIKEESTADPMESLVEKLADSRLLLVLDNFEHLLYASEAVASLLERCRQLSFLVTSRTPLRLRREQEYPVQPLALPDPNHLPADLSQLSQYDSVALFIDRARAVRPDFDVTNENAPAVAEICARVDGLPLAIELAAARIKLFPPAALLSRLETRMKILTGGARDVPERQRTLRGAIDWSYSLLTEEEQTLFARLSVFVGGFTFEAAEAVCAHNGDLDLFVGLESLVEKSLLRQEGQDEPRFSMLETIREYARERLEASGDEHAMRDAHAAYFLALAEHAKAGMRTAEHGRWMANLAQESENLRQALEYLLQGSDLERACRLAVALTQFWRHSGWFTEGNRLFGTLLPHASKLEPALEAELHFSASFFQRTLARHLEELRHSLELYRRLGDLYGMSETLRALAAFTMEAGNYDDARRHGEESLVLARQMGDPGSILDNLLSLGSLAFYQNDLAGARAVLEEAHDLAVELGDPVRLATGWYWISWLSLATGDSTRAERAACEAERLYAELGMEKLRRMVSWARAVLALVEHKPDDAVQHLDNVMDPDTKEDVPFTYRFIEAYACAAAQRGRAVRAARLWGAAQARRDQEGAPMEPITRDRLLPFVEEVRATVDAAAWDTELREGALMSTAAINAYAVQDSD